MTQDLKLYMILLGGRLKGHHTEQHDIFFGIAESLKDLVEDFYTFWPEMKGKMHIDCWREVNIVDNYAISIIPKTTQNADYKLFFINLGGYKPGEFEEYHYKMIVAAKSMSQAIQLAKQTAFFKHYSFDGATSHIDDKYGIDVDDIYAVEDILPNYMKENYSIHLSPTATTKKDELHIGYLKMEKLLKQKTE